MFVVPESSIYDGILTGIVVAELFPEALEDFRQKIRNLQLAIHTNKIDGEKEYRSSLSEI